MALSLHQMVEAQMYMGHRTNRWNPKMKSFILATHNNFHILDLIKSYYYTRNALRFVQVAASEGKSILFVGTKKEAKPFISEFALESNSFYINEKWVGGLLTNFKTFKKSTKKLLRLERQAENGFLDKLPKKETAKKLKEKDKLTRLFDGIKHMRTLPDIVIIVGQSEEINAVNECHRLGIRTITLLDTDCNPTLADYLIPANDDSPATIKLLLQCFASAILEGQEFYDRQNPAQLEKDQQEQKRQKGRRGQKGQKDQSSQPRKRVQRNKSSIQWRQQKEALKQAQKEMPTKKAAPVPELLERPKWVPQETANA